MHNHKFWSLDVVSLFDFNLSFAHSSSYVALATIFLLLLVIYNPRLMLQDYPPAIKKTVPAKTDKEKRLSTWLGLSFMLVLFVFPIYATFAFNLWDWLVLDQLIFCTITPKRFVIPGNEGYPAYKDYFFHFRGFLIGTVFSAVMGLIGAGIVTIFG